MRCVILCHQRTIKCSLFVLLLIYTWLETYQILILFIIIALPSISCVRCIHWPTLRSASEAIVYIILHLFKQKVAAFKAFLLVWLFVIKIICCIQKFLLYLFFLLLFQLQLMLNHVQVILLVLHFLLLEQTQLLLLLRTQG